MGMAKGERPDEAVRPTGIGRAARLARPAAALLPSALGAMVVCLLFLIATVVLFAVALLGAGCAFTQMCFEELDPYRDLPGSGGIGGSSTGGC